MEAIASNNEKICTGTAVLVRNNTFQNWQYNIFCNYEKDELYSYICITDNFAICIPYTNNEHLLGTDKNFDREFKFGNKVKGNTYDENTGKAIQVEGILIGINPYHKEYTYEIATNGFDTNQSSTIYYCEKIELIED